MRGACPRRSATGSVWPPPPPPALDCQRRDEMLLYSNWAFPHQLWLNLATCLPKFLQALLPLPLPKTQNPPPPLRTRKAKLALKANSPSLSARAAKRSRSWGLSRLLALLESLSGGKRATRLLQLAWVAAFCHALHYLHFKRCKRMHMHSTLSAVHHHCSRRL